MAGDLEGSWEYPEVSVRTRRLSFGSGPQLGLFMKRKSCLEKPVTQQGLWFFRWLGDGLPAWNSTLWKWQSHVAWGGQVLGRVDGPGGPLETEGSKEPCRGLSKRVTW